MRYSALFLFLCVFYTLNTTAKGQRAAKPTVTNFDCPKYPAKAESLGLQGMVQLEVTTDGTTLEV